MTMPFAGRRRNEGLGRSVSVVEVSSSAVGRTGDKGCSLDAEEGNVVGSQPTKREHPTRG
jgi:hypothetical protein